MLANKEGKIYREPNSSVDAKQDKKVKVAKIRFILPFVPRQELISKYEWVSDGTLLWKGRWPGEFNLP